MNKPIGCLNDIPRAILAHAPTPLEEMPNLAKAVGGARLYVKRDDCTGLGMGGNKVRQLEFYLGEAVARGADTILITGAVQSNFTRTAAAAARKLGMDIHVQAEQRVPNVSPQYNRSGNMLLNRVLGAILHSFPEGENEAGADRNLETISEELRKEGRNPYVIHLAQGHPPLGALGYVVAAREIVEQIDQHGLSFDEIVVASGSGATHSGLLFGLRALGCQVPVKGICVRRNAEAQRPRIVAHCRNIATLLHMENPVADVDVYVNDDVLAPGYGQMNDAVLDAIKLTAQTEGIILDPVYTGRTMAGFLNRARASEPGRNLLFIHTGGAPAVFGYEEALAPMLSDPAR